MRVYLKKHILEILREIYDFLHEYDLPNLKQDETKMFKGL